MASAIQLRVGSDKAENRAAAERYVREAARQGAALVVLPELFYWGGKRSAERKAAEAIPGPTSQWISDLARELALYIVGGSILERSEGNEKVYNTCIVFAPNGDLVGRYRKIHLFDVDVEGRVSIRESDTRLSGSDPVFLDTDLGRIGLGVCYDLRFPELFRHLEGAQLICLPSAFTFATGAHHWEPLLRARAIENQAYVIAPNQCGKGDSGIACYGSSMIVDPWGAVIARASEGDGCIVGTIDLDYVQRVRREIPCLNHRAIG